jgi:hypothetical protein
VIEVVVEISGRDHWSSSSRSLVEAERSVVKVAIEIDGRGGEVGDRSD